MAQDTRTLKSVLSAAALEGFVAYVFQFDGGQTVTVEQAGTPNLRVTHQWGGDEESRTYDAIEAHVAEHRHRREDDPRVQHEPVVVAGY